MLGYLVDGLFVVLCDVWLQQQSMSKYQVVSSIMGNIYELGELPFLRREVHTWFRFKEKEKYLPLLRSISYQGGLAMSKIFVFDVSEEKKERKVFRFLTVVTEKEVMGVEQLYQVLNEGVGQKEFSEQVQRIKQFERGVYRFVGGVLAKNLLGFINSKDFIGFNVYRSGEEFYVKGTFKDYNYSIQMDEQTEQFDCVPPSVYRISNEVVKARLRQKSEAMAKLLETMVINQEQITKLYASFYDNTCFLYDEYMLRLQVFGNYPNLRLKNFVPIKFRDYKTDAPLEGPIFSNADEECMYGHFTGYNANSIKLVEGEYCEICMAAIEQLQENELLMMLRDNIFNPEKLDVLYNPEFNRFKLLQREQVGQGEQMEGEQNTGKVYFKTKIRYLNYSHFRMNLKKMTNKNRLTFTFLGQEESFPLTFTFLNKKLLIMDPARGRFCRHYTFTDLRLFYESYDEETGLYACPVAGCGEQMVDGDILYLKEAAVLMEYAKFKCEDCADLIDCAKVVIDHSKRITYVTYKVREEGTVLSKLDELIDYFRTMSDPYVPFPEYSLGMREKEHKKKMEEYMFGGLRKGMEEEQQIQQQEDDEIYQNL